VNPARPRVAVGLGARRGVSAPDLRAAVDAALTRTGLTTGQVTVLATIDRRAAEEGVRSLARDLGWRLVALPAADLAGQAVPRPSARVERLAGTAGVAEAAALLAAGPGAELVLGKQVFTAVTLAVARSRG
jgi:cobalt-precorrin 5A hydrolase